MAQAATKILRIRPQPGPQERFMACPADLAVFGGSAFGGKTFSLLMEPLRHIHVPHFTCTVFRRTSEQIRKQGGLWDESYEVYAGSRGVPKEHTLKWQFPGSQISFDAMQYEKDKYNYDGAQICLLGFDQLEHFSRGQFFYMLSRNRSLCGVRPYVRATCNPDPDSFLRQLLDWWINPETGYAIEERSGIIRWFATIADEVIWADTRQALIDQYGPETEPKSFTFIPSNAYDNKIGLEKNPDYIANLKALNLIDRERLFKGNWNIRESAGMFFKREWFEIVEAAPAGLQEIIRYWDRAASTETGSSFTAGCKMGRNGDGGVWILDMARFQGTPGRVKETIRNVASQDGTRCTVGIEQDPGQAGKAEAQDQVRNLSGYYAVINIVREDKATRAKPLSAQTEAGNVKLVRGPWIEAFLNEAENFDGVRKPNDQIDAASGGYYMLNHPRKVIGVIGKRY